MAANLRQLEQDRALLLAGVSHDLRTPLARLRLGVEMQSIDEATRAGMVDDIGEMDRIIGQFLEFARTDADTAREPSDPMTSSGRASSAMRAPARTFASCPAALPPIPLRRTSFSRLVANLVDNAIAYGAPPVEVATRMAGGDFVLDVADRGPGIAPGEVERLKQPFTRASAARTNAAGVAGAGLGLAIVDRIARLHDGTLDLLPRDGGGTVRASVDDSDPASVSDRTSIHAPRAALLRRHADRAVEADHLAVQHDVLHDLTDERRELGRAGRAAAETAPSCPAPPRCRAESARPSASRRCPARSPSRGCRYARGRAPSAASSPPRPPSTRRRRPARSGRRTRRPTPC